MDIIDTTMDATSRAVAVALPVPDQARQLVITTNDQYEEVAAFLLKLKAIRRKIDDAFNPIITKAHEAHKEAVAQRKKAGEPLDLAESIIKPKIVGYIQEQEKKRVQEEARLQAEAKKQQDDEALVLAELSKQSGNHEEAQAILEEGAHAEAPVIVLPKETPKVEGISTREVWKFRIVNPTLVPREYLIVDEKKVGGVVRSLKNLTNIPGVQVYSEKVVAAGIGRYGNEF